MLLVNFKSSQPNLKEYTQHSYFANFTTMHQTLTLIVGLAIAILTSKAKFIIL